jgi:hypothetical protein
MALAAVLVVLSWGQGRVHAMPPPPDGTANIHFNTLPQGKVPNQCVFIDVKIEPKNSDPNAPKIQVGYACDGLAAGQATPAGASKQLTTDSDQANGKDGIIVLVLAADGYSFEIDQGRMAETNRQLSTGKRVHCDLLNSQECFVKYSFESPVGGLAMDLDGELGDLPLETAQSSGVSAGLLAGVIGGIMAVAITATGAAWYARRRWIS